RLTQRLEHGTDPIAETLRLSGADVENTIDACCLQQPPQDGNRIVYINEVAALVPIGDSLTVRLEQLHRLARLCQVQDFGKNACHVPLVIFVRAIDVEKLQPDPVWWHFFSLHAAINHRKIEQVLAPSVEIHRLEASQRLQPPVIVQTIAALASGRG